MCATTAKNVSSAGMAFIAGFEGLERRGGQSRYAAKGTNLAAEDKTKYYMYLDPIRLPTIGIGHLITDAEKASGNIIPMPIRKII